MNAKKQDWTRFCKRIVIEKPLAEIYTAWTTMSKIESWFLEKAVYYDINGRLRALDEPFEDGDTFIWKWNNWDFEEKGQILEANGKDQLCFTFGKGGNVSIQLKPVNGNTEVILTQYDIPTDEQSKMDLYVGCSTGWTFWMANLKAWSEHGITLHATRIPQAQTKDLVNS